MKLSTLEQLTDAVERIASRLDSQEPYKVDLSNYLTKAEASDTYALKANCIFKSEQDVVNEFGGISSQPGAVWIDLSGNVPSLNVYHHNSVWYIQFNNSGITDPN